MVFVHTFLLSIIDLAKITSMNTWILRWRLGVKPSVPRNGAKHFPYTTWPLNQGSFQMNSSTEMSIREWKMFPCDRIIWASQCDILLAILQQLILDFWIFSNYKRWNIVGVEAEEIWCFASETRCEAARENQNWVSFYSSREILSTRISSCAGQRLTHAFRCIIWFFWRNNLARVNRLGTLCMAGILEQTKNMMLA